jgi:hypothetical protein
MANFSFTIDGLAGFRSKVQSAAANLPQNLGKALYQFGEEVMAVSKERVPVDTGALMGSGFVTPPEHSGSVISVTVGYGGPSVNYALAVHEDMNPKRHWRRPGSGPKFLENPLKEKQNELRQRAADGVKLGFAA